MFLKNREFRVKMVKNQENNKKDTPPTMDEVLNPDSVNLIEEAGRKFVRHLAATVIVVVVAIKVVDTLGEIAVKKTKSPDNE